MDRRKSRPNRQNSRTDRIGSTLREAIAQALVRIGDESVEYITVTEVEVDSELTRAKVYLSSLDLSDADIEGVRAHTPRIRKAIARNTRLRRVPQLLFMVDPGLVSGSRVTEVLAKMGQERAIAENLEDRLDPETEQGW